MSFVQKEIVELSDGDDSEPVSGPELEDDDEVISEKNGTLKQRTKIKMVFKPKSKGTKGLFNGYCISFFCYLIVRACIRQRFEKQFSLLKKKKKMDMHRMNSKWEKSYL